MNGIFISRTLLLSSILTLESIPKLMFTFFINIETADGERHCRIREQIWVAGECLLSAETELNINTDTEPSLSADACYRLANVQWINLFVLGE